MSRCLFPLIADDLDQSVFPEAFEQTLHSPHVIQLSDPDEEDEFDKPLSSEDEDDEDFEDDLFDDLDDDDLDDEFDDLDDDEEEDEDEEEDDY